MLFPKNLEPALSQDLFRNPTSEYRGTPFWAWNAWRTEGLSWSYEYQPKQMGLLVAPKLFG